MRRAHVALTAVVALLAAIGLATAAVAAGAGGSSVDGLPQEGLTLGKPGAPVELIEYGDLQCPICKEYAAKVLPRVIRKEVATGKAKLTFRNYAIIGPQSFPAGAAALAAGEQGRGWSFLEIFFRNQEDENSGYATSAYLETIAESAGVEDLERWNLERKSAKLRNEVRATTREASHKLKFEGTPSFTVRGPRTHGLRILGTPGTAAALEAAIAEAR